MPRIGGIIEARRKRIEGDLAEANRLKEQSDAALAAYEKSLADARGRAQAIGQRDPRQAQRRGRGGAARRWRRSSTRKLAEAEKTIAATKTAAMANVRGIAVDTAARHRRSG